MKPEDLSYEYLHQKGLCEIAITPHEGGYTVALLHREAPTEDWHVAHTVVVSKNEEARIQVLEMKIKIVETWRHAPYVYNRSLQYVFGDRYAVTELKSPDLGPQPHTPH